ncbi:MAG: hypothetical protein KME43_27095 [Myxacorys chilensis ATA2-1-KO14]|jgi:hypothetical protein|nr:hypothetical protein [Myxacorys chilensis ATA2-1-KO14]
MRQLFWISFFTALVVFGATFLGSVPAPFVASDNLNFLKSQPIVSISSSANNAIEIDGIRFETLVPQNIVRLPKRGEEVNVQFRVRITNQTSTPYRFNLQRFLPEMSNSQGQMLVVGGGRNSSTEIEESDIPLLKPGESTEFLMNAKLLWREKRISLVGYALYGSIVEFYNLHSGQYQIRFEYENLQPRREMLLITTGRTQVGNLWVGKVVTSFAGITFQ